MWKLIPFLLLLLATLTHVQGPSVVTPTTPHTFTFVSHQQPCVVATTNTCSGTVTGIGAGNLLVIDTQYGHTVSAATAVACIDTAGGNTYTNTTPNGFIAFTTASGIDQGGLPYTLSSNSGSHTIQCTWTRSGGADIAISVDTMEFSCIPACSTVVFDKDAIGSKPSGTCNSPFTSNTSFPISNGELVIGDFLTGLGSASTANSPWTLVVSGNGEYYVLNSFGAVQANWVDTTASGDSCGSTIGAWK
jgi:hypothetical protein